MSTDEGYCTAFDACQCGGDLPAIRAMCSSWSPEPHPEYVRGYHAAMREMGLVVFDGPGAFSGVQKAARKLNSEIDAAGGLDAWRALPVPDPQLAASGSAPSTLQADEQKGAL
jgi:hypothetical protein